jgi:hypothetical protein
LAEIPPTDKGTNQAVPAGLQGSSGALPLFRNNVNWLTISCVTP